MIWETILSNIFQYTPQSLSKVKYVTSPLPENIILTTRAKQQFAGSNDCHVITVAILSCHVMSSPVLSLRHLSCDPHYALMVMKINDVMTLCRENQRYYLSRYLSRPDGRPPTH
jgi:hypothetical protein